MSIQEPQLAQDEKSARFVAEYLQKNPDFLKNHPEVLEKLYLPHRSGAAVSLVEKQQAVLRERNTELRTKLGNLLDSSKTNDELFDKTRQLILNLIKAEGLNDVLNTVHRGLTEQFAVPFYGLGFIDMNIAGVGTVNTSSEQLKSDLPELLSKNTSICGVLRPKQMQLLFGPTGRRVGSAVAIALVAQQQTYGFLALGNPNPNYYHSNMDSLFLSFITDVLNLVLHPKL
jgi:Uncharacterized protein conserved in bacteria